MLYIPHEITVSANQTGKLKDAITGKKQENEDKI